MKDTYDKYEKEATEVPMKKGRHHKKGMKEMGRKMRKGKRK